MSSQVLSDREIEKAATSNSTIPGYAERIRADYGLEAGEGRSGIASYTLRIDIATREGLKPIRSSCCNRGAAWLYPALKSDEENTFASVIADAENCTVGRGESMESESYGPLRRAWRHSA